MPKEPPTLQVRMRTLSCGTPRISASWFLMPNTPWPGAVSVQLPDSLVVRADRRARLHRRNHHARVSQRQPGNVRGLRESRGDLLRLPEQEVDAHVARHVVVELRRAGPAPPRSRAPPRAAARCRAPPPRPRPSPAARSRRPRRPPGRPRSAPCPTASDLRIGLLHRRAVAVLEVERALVRAVGRRSSPV